MLLKDNIAVQTVRRVFAVLLAKFLSLVLSPPLALLYGSFIAVGQPLAMKQLIGGYFSFCVGLPMSYLTWLVYSGAVDDFDIGNREQRFRPFLVTVCGLAIGTIYLLLQDAPMMFQVFSVASCFSATVALIVTLRWKISIHSAASALVFGLSAWVYRDVGSVLLGCAGLTAVGWSRLLLGCHSFSQVCAGALLGLISLLLCGSVLGV